MFELLIIVFGAIGLGFLLILLLAFSDKKRKARLPETPIESALSRNQFEKICVELIERMKLEIQDIQRSENDDLEVMAKNPTPITGGDFFIRCVYVEPERKIESAEIIEMSNVIIQDRLSKGIFMTNGRFTEAIPSIGELAPIEYIDASALKTLMEKYGVIPSS